MRGSVPKWSYRDALEMRLSSNRHKSSNLFASAKTIKPKRAFFVNFLVFVLQFYKKLLQYSQTQMERI